MAEPKRKLTFQRDKGLGKLKLRFEDGQLSLELSKHRSAHTLSREEAQELALWLSAWSLKLLDSDARAEAAAADGRAREGVEAGDERKPEATASKKKRDKKRKKARAAEGAAGARRTGYELGAGEQPPDVDAAG